jgi:DNA-binding CsgD family transcriptional regulator
MDSDETSGLPNHNFYNELVEMWQENMQRKEYENLALKYAETSRILGQYAQINNHTISIYSTKTQEVFYMSENYLSMTGYSCTEQEYKRWATFYWMRDLPLAQSWFFVQMSLFYRTVVRPRLKEKQGTKNFRFYIHNLMLHPPGSYRHHFSIIGDSLEITPQGSVLVMLTIKKDVTGLIKENGYWWAEYTINNELKYHFHQMEKKFQRGGILSERELEVAVLVKRGLETKQIAEQLFISPHTVDKHRKNMLERTGARDFSSLIQICEMAQII